MADAIDLDFLKRAIEASKKAEVSKTCFRVGAVLVSPNRDFIAEGFTLELGEGLHAEAVAIKKALNAGINPKGSTIYSSIEPCSTRASGKRDCSSLLIEQGISKVVFALAEPPIFVIGQGKDKLKAAGINVEHPKEFEDLVIDINKHLFNKS